jgi:hypothetical protein
MIHRILTFTTVHESEDSVWFITREYSPQFDAHDDEEGGQDNSGGGDADVDHTTSFAIRDDSHRQ